jgi:hypothetical protein
MDPTEIRTLEFTRGSSRETDWYMAPTPFGPKYIVTKNKKGTWDCVRPGCNSSPGNRPIKPTLQEAVDFCQDHFNKSIGSCIHGSYESKRPRQPSKYPPA